MTFISKLYNTLGLPIRLIFSHETVNRIGMLSLRDERYDIVKKHLQGRLIDIGCGNGSISLFLWQLGAKVHSIDTSKEALQVNRSLRNLNEESRHFDPNLCQGDAMRLPYKEETFDIVCCLETLEFVADDIPAINEIERVTKQGGKVILFIPYDTRMDDEGESLGYYRRYSIKTMKKKLCSGQLSIKRLVFWYFPVLKLLDLRIWQSCLIHQSML